MFIFLKQRLITMQTAPRSSLEFPVFLDNPTLRLSDRLPEVFRWNACSCLWYNLHAVKKNLSYSESVCFWNSSIARIFKQLENITFQKLDLFPSSGEGRSSDWDKFFLRDSAELVSPYLHLMTETDQVSEMLCFLVIWNSVIWTKSRNPVILSVIHISTIVRTF
jgi:hypothetical protein